MQNWAENVWAEWFYGIKFNLLLKTRRIQTNLFQLFFSTVIEILLRTNRNQHFWIKVPISSGMSNSKENANLKEREEENGFSDPRFYFHFLKSGFPLGASGKKSSLNFCFEGLQLNHCHLHNTWHDQIFNCIQRQANYAVKMIYHGLNI